ncbi:MAG TPA: bifunctional diguanylate cyclase/phosphodiesterase, partial [Candidatus Nanopelagicales bacterium]|nr:bifunctional diguanylate cyclase/phosphodiesterase [Candidatus Nanopelagicales bacterium]
AVLFIDLDNFKVINDSLGHAAGDDVLCAVAERIAGTLRARDYAARLGGDEFVVVGTDMRSATEAEALAARVTRVIQDDLEIDGHPLVLGASVGVALSRAGSTAASMLRDADSALFRAKANGRARWQFFDDTMHAAALARLTTESELRHGLAERQFVPYYQPIVGLDPRRITGYEALVRWQHPERGLLPPADFLPVAEETGLIIELGAQMLDHVCRVIATRSDIAGTISVNKSPLQINRPEWRARFLDTVKRNRADPRRLIIEVTESAVLSRIDSVADDLQALRRLGVGLHIDDFGTGYSSISLLRDLPVTGVKLDRTFTEHLADEKGARVVAAGLASLADGLDLVSIAEGIEEPEQAEILTDLGWTHGQGYLFGRPAPDLVTDLPTG